MLIIIKIVLNNTVMVKKSENTKKDIESLKIYPIILSEQNFKFRNLTSIVGFERSLTRPLRFRRNLFENIEKFKNSLLEGNLKELDLNINALVNTLTELNLENLILKKESNFIKLIKFEEIELENPND